MDYDDRHEVLVTVGGSEAIDMAMRVMLNPGEEVLIPQPSYVFMNRVPLWQAVNRRSLN